MTNLPQGKTCGHCANWLECYSRIMRPEGGRECVAEELKFVDKDKPKEKV